jgi:arginine/lysine/ornithine decarboxylase
MIADLEALERAANLFPGFENEIQGLYREKAGDVFGALLHLWDARGVASPA